MPRSTAYVDALRMLARRELAEAQVRERLIRRGHDEAEVNDAVARLRAEKAIDDARVAEAIAHTETAIRRRGRLRVRRQIERAGIAGAVARQAVDSAFDGIDDQALLEEAITRRLRGADAIGDDKAFARLFRYLVAQGFEPDRIVLALKRRRIGSRT